VHFTKYRHGNTIHELVHGARSTCKLCVLSAVVDPNAKGGEKRKTVVPDGTGGHKLVPRPRKVCNTCGTNLCNSCFIPYHQMKFPHGKKWT
jgi:hypothetical protein